MLKGGCVVQLQTDGGVPLRSHKGTDSDKGPKLGFEAYFVMARVGEDQMLQRGDKKAP